jgi:hypothetical protein
MKFTPGNIVRNGQRWWKIHSITASHYRVTRIDGILYDAQMPIYWVDENCELDDEYIIDKVLKKYSDG